MPLAHLLAVLTALAALPGCTLVKTLLHGGADLDDHRIFANRTVATAGEPSPLRTLAGTPAFVAAMRVPDENGKEHALEDYLDETRTAAFVVLHEDRIVFERYARGFTAESPLNSFSIAKAIVATLAGIAIAEGRMGLDDAVARHRPDLAATAYGGVRIRDLLAMTSGVGDAPSWLPGRAQHYYGDDLLDVVSRSVPEKRDGRGWRYSEADVQVLGFALQAATGMPLSDYLADRLWKPLGMEAPALWALDREGGSEKAFCCVSARARDFARLGRLFLDAGRWQGRQIVSEHWAERRAVAGIRTDDGYLHHQLWWEPPGPAGDFYAYGHNGQYLYVNPAARVVIVKFSETERQDPVPMFRTIAGSLGVPAHLAQIRQLQRDTLASPSSVAHFEALQTP